MRALSHNDCSRVTPSWLGIVPLSEFPPRNLMKGVSRAQQAHFHSFRASLTTSRATAAPVESGLFRKGSSPRGVCPAKRDQRRFVSLCFSLALNAVQGCERCQQAEQSWDCARQETIGVETPAAGNDETRSLLQVLEWRQHQLCRNCAAELVGIEVSGNKNIRLRPVFVSINHSHRYTAIASQGTELRHSKLTGNCSVQVVAGEIPDKQSKR